MSGTLVKVEGAGNDFLLGVGAWAAPLASDAELVRRLCRRRLGIGADGTLALFAEPPEAVRVVYRNADGGEASFCANGTRCAARAAVELLGLPERLTVRTAWAEIPAVVAGGTVSLDLPAPPAPLRKLRLNVEGSDWEAELLEVGVPHLVVSVAGDLDAFPVARVGPALRSHPALGAAGANVNFVSAAGAGRVALRSWERGVEGETLSCGSGVVAAAMVWLAERGGRRLVCQTRSGQDLDVELLGTPPACPTRLTGPAHIVAEVAPTE